MEQNQTDYFSLIRIRACISQALFFFLRYNYMHYYGEDPHYDLEVIIMIDKEGLKKLIGERVSESETISKMSETLFEVLVNIITEYFGCDDINDVERFTEDMSYEEGDAFFEEIVKYFASVVMKKIFTF